MEEEEEYSYYDEEEGTTSINKSQKKSISKSGSKHKHETRNLSLKKMSESLQGSAPLTDVKIIVGDWKRGSDNMDK